METLPAQREFNEKEVALIRNLFTKGCSEEEFGLFVTLAKTYQLDPFKNQIWCVKYGSGPARVFTGRDGFLEIAHRSGQFDGMESGYRDEKEKCEIRDGDKIREEWRMRIIGWAKVFRKDMTHPFTVEVDLDEYKKDTAAWKQMPRTMIQKVAESQALRKAFSASGLYAPEEFGEPEPKPEMKNVTPVKTGEGMEQIIDADAKQAEKTKGALQKPPEKKRQVKVGGKWVDEDKADLIGKG